MLKMYQNKTALIQALVKKSDVVLDVGFWGQGVSVDDPHWVHNLLKGQSDHVYGLDLDYDEAKLQNLDHYKKLSAENFDFGVQFDLIFAGDLIEHLSNPGLFLASCARNLKPGGKMILTTPNCFNLFNLTEKLVNSEPTVNKDHTCYFNIKTLRQLLVKNHWSVEEYSFLYSLEVAYKQSWKKKILNVIYFILSKFTTKYLVDLVVIATKK